MAWSIAPLWNKGNRECCASVLKALYRFLQISSANGKYLMVMFCYNFFSPQTHPLCYRLPKKVNTARFWFSFLSHASTSCDQWKLAVVGFSLFMHCLICCYWSQLGTLQWTNFGKWRFIVQETLHKYQFWLKKKKSQEILLTCKMWLPEKPVKNYSTHSMLASLYTSKVSRCQVLAQLVLVRVFIFWYSIHGYLLFWEAKCS